MKIQPLGARVLVKVDKPKEETKSGIILTEGSLNPNYFTGKVLAVGPDVGTGINVAMASSTTATRIKQHLNKGDIVAFLKYGYEDMGDGQYVVEENSLIGIIENE